MLGDANEPQAILTDRPRRMTAADPVEGPAAAPPTPTASDASASDASAPASEISIPAPSHDAASSSRPKCEVVVHTDASAYEAGDVVTGTVTVTCAESIRAKVRPPRPRPRPQPPTPRSSAPPGAFVRSFVRRRRLSRPADDPSSPALLSAWR